MSLEKEAGSKTRILTDPAQSSGFLPVFEPDPVLSQSQEVVETTSPAEISLVALLANLLAEIRAGLQGEGYPLPSVEVQVLQGLLELWLAASRYQLLKKGIDPFAELIKLHEQLASTKGWLEPPHLGQAIVEMLQKFRPNAAPSSWQPDQNSGLRLCHELNKLHHYPALNSPEFFAIWLELVGLPQSQPKPELSQVQVNAYPAKPCPPQQPGLWEEVSPAPNWLPELEAQAQVKEGPLTQANALVDQIYLVSDQSDGQALATEFARRVAAYQAANARLLQAERSSSASTEGATAAQLDMFGYAAQVAGQPEIETNIPRLVLGHFRAAPDLEPPRRQAAELTLWACAFKAYAGRISIFTTLPDWELI